MGRRNAFTFAKRQRELEKKKKKEAKRAARQLRKDGLDPDAELADGVVDPDVPVDPDAPVAPVATGEADDLSPASPSEPGPDSDA